MKNVPCFLVEPTGRYSDPEDGISRMIYKRVDSGAEFFAIPIGAMWYVDPIEQKHYRPGPDGRTLFGQTPGGVWSPDSRASNCTLPDDKEHFCWVRHGVPPMITVDKKGKTCKAGAGSILMGKYHGFLQNGQLTNCP